ncbi:RNA-directed DNA polymerase (reverse transcriptase)-related family protein [Rhynchospora pubera]|uniref:RNA-directed DNA polymerase (Reverse transcriptase)-related family protein n=1 Tax=Rhynchospora pubera TaxID=906938 RepID=A0AAV8F0N6_9POAL|nr:RNA-directed DNA polymerase (reverse transcriptase)-related family protein [Rhynchospora pubera]
MCPALTHVIYADDLILTGYAEQEEIQQLTTIMEQFGRASGLVINPAKSKVWCSKRCDQQSIQMVHNMLAIEESEVEERYLGALLTPKNCAKKTGIMLLEKLNSKLTGWRSNLLSHAGRLVLIQSALMSIPVYFMSVKMIPKGIIKKMESLIAKFFWGKTDQVRYMSFVSWQRICQSREQGGLGIRQLQLFGEALYLKLIWAMISDADKLWVQCKGKYYQNLGFWRASNIAGTSPLWRQAMKMREFFKRNIKWQIGDGARIKVLSQPWYTEWQIAEQACRADKRLTVDEIFDFETDQWRRAEVIRLLGLGALNHIEQSGQKPCRTVNMRDKLVWDGNKSGNYTVKDGYECLLRRRGNQAQEVRWQYIWKWKHIIPKVKTFMWRLLTNGLPLAQNMHARIHSFSPRCIRCNQENEYAMHCFFFCEGSRMVWFGGCLGIRTDSLPLNISDDVEAITQNMSEERIPIFCYTLWEIWLARNEMIFQSKKFDPGGVCKKIQNWEGRRNNGAGSNRSMLVPKEVMPYEYAPYGWQIIIDASWDTSNRAGSAFLVYCQGLLEEMGMEKHDSADPFQAEAKTLLKAMQWVQKLIYERGIQRVQIFCDCFNLVNALVEDNLDSIPSWQARPIIANIAQHMETLRNMICIQHVSREAVRPAHDMANHARRRGVSYQGIPMAAIMCEHKIGIEIDSTFFQQVQEAPP